MAPVRTSPGSLVQMPANTESQVGMCHSAPLESAHVPENRNHQRLVTSPHRSDHRTGDRSQSSTMVHRQRHTIEITSRVLSASSESRQPLSPSSSTPSATDTSLTSLPQPDRCSHQITLDNMTPLIGHQRGYPGATHKHDIDGWRPIEG